MCLAPSTPLFSRPNVLYRSFGISVSHEHRGHHHLLRPSPRIFTLSPRVSSVSGLARTAGRRLVAGQRDVQRFSILRVSDLRCYKKPHPENLRIGPSFSVFGPGEEGCMYGIGAVPSHGKRLCVLGPPE